MSQLLSPQDFDLGIALSKAIATIRTPDELRRSLAEATRLLNAEASLVFRIPPEGQPTGVFFELCERTVCQYRSMGLLEADPVFRRHMESGGLQIWSETWEQNPPSREIVEFFHSRGYRAGISHGLKDIFTSVQTLVVFLSSRTLGYRESMLTEILIASFHQAVLRCMDARDSTPAAFSCLSGREIEIIRWIQAGKTSWEVGCLLDISERTVKYHLGKIFRKLGVTNRSQVLGLLINSPPASGDGSSHALPESEFALDGS